MFCHVARSPIVSLLEALILFTAEPDALKTFAAEPGAPNTNIWTSLHTDSGSLFVDRW